MNLAELEKDQIDADFRPLISNGSVSLVGDVKSVPVTIPRDTAAKQSLIRGGVLPFSDQSYCGSDVLAWGIKMSVVRAPLHFVQLTSRIVSGKFQIAVRSQLPVAGIDLLLGNDLAGGKVFPSPEVIENPITNVCISDPAGSDSLPLFPVCAVTRAEARKVGDLVDLSDSFMSSSDPTSSLLECEEKAPVSTELQPDVETLTRSVDRKRLIKDQKTDATLSSCFSRVNNPTCDKSVSYLLDEGVLMRSWLWCYARVRVPNCSATAVPFLGLESGS